MVSQNMKAKNDIVRQAQYTRWNSKARTVYGWRHGIDAGAQQSEKIKDKMGYKLGCITDKRQGHWVMKWII